MVARHSNKGRFPALLLPILPTFVENSVQDTELIQPAFTDQVSD
jgi:hypothetical protein